jgi:hypothetical protein
MHTSRCSRSSYTCLGERFHGHSSTSFIDVPTNPGPRFLPCPARALVPLRTCLSPFLRLLEIPSTFPK